LKKDTGTREEDRYRSNAREGIQEHGIGRDAFARKDIEGLIV
jgi:hypothetical protein